jgi:hypothetical protein
MENAYDFPAEFPDDPEAGQTALRWAVAIVAMTALALSVLNAQAIAEWAAELPANPVTAKIVATADGWNARVAKAGLDTPRKDLHGAWKRAEATRWSTDSPSIARPR